MWLRFAKTTLDPQDWCHEAAERLASSAKDFWERQGGRNTPNLPLTLCKKLTSELIDVVSEHHDVKGGPLDAIRSGHTAV